MPCSHQAPVGPERQAIRRSRCCLPLVTQRRLPRLVIPGLDHTAYIFAVYASQRRLPERHARLASGRRPTLPGRDSTRRICSEGFRNDDSSHVISSPFPELRSAHATFTLPHLLIRNVGRVGDRDQRTPNIMSECLAPFMPFMAPFTISQAGPRIERSSASERQTLAEKRRRE